MGAASGLAGRPIHLGIISRMTAFRTRLITALALAGAVVWTPGTPAQQTQRLLYAALPGVGGGNNLKYGGAGILVFDIDHGHKFVRRIPLQGAPPPSGAAPNRSGPGGGGQEAIKGIAANAQTA